MRIFWCCVEKWLGSSSAAECFCRQAGINAREFSSREELALHAAGRFLLFKGYAEYTGEKFPPPLRIGEGGKPCFSGGLPCFNISHSGDIALCAFGGSETGADIEKLAPAELSLMDVFKPEERDYVLSRPEGDRDRAFYELWTARESLIKAKGGGLSDMFDLESVITDDGRWKTEVSGCRLYSLSFPEPGYAAAVSTKEEERDIRWICVELP